MNTSMGSVEPYKRVAQGSKFLDEKCPDWWKKIEISELDMTSPWSCILGQIYGSFQDGRQALHLECNCNMDPELPCTFQRLGFVGVTYSDREELVKSWATAVVNRRKDNHWVSPSPSEEIC